jgi:hypothetical protein
LSRFQLEASAPKRKGEDEDVEQVRLARQRGNGEKKCGRKPGEADAGGA